MSSSQGQMAENSAINCDENPIKDILDDPIKENCSQIDDKNTQTDITIETPKNEKVIQNVILLESHNNNINNLVSSEPLLENKGMPSEATESKIKYSFNLYPTLNSVFKYLLNRNTKFQFPKNNTPVFNGWESAVYHAILDGCDNISQIRRFIFGSWVLDSSGQFIQLNYSNLSILLTSKVLLETSFFEIDNLSLEDFDQTNDKLKIRISPNCSFNSRHRYIFDSENDFPFQILVIHKSIETLKKQNSFTIDDLLTVLNQKTYRTPVDTYEFVTKDDTFRIQYILEQSNYFQKDENGNYSEGNVTFGSLTENDLQNDQTSTQNELVNIMIRSFPIGHCFYKSEIENIAKSKNIIFSEKELIQHSRIFFIGNKYGVRPNFEFRKQVKAHHMISDIPDILFGVIIQVLSKLTRPISMASLFHSVKKQIYFDILNGPQVINEDVYNKIRVFMKTSPIVICQNHKYFIIPTICECDIYGQMYISSIRDYCMRNVSRITDRGNANSQLLNEFRFPITKNEAVFVVYIKSQPKALLDLFEIPTANKKSNEKEINDDKELNLVIETINNSVFDDGEISENEFLHNEENPANPKNSSNDNKTKGTYSNTTSAKKNLINFLNFGAKTTKTDDIYIKARKQKKLLDNIPVMSSSADQLNENQIRSDIDAASDFESDATISDLEKKMIRVTLKNFNPKIYSFSRPSDYAEILKGQKAVNIEGREFTIDNSPESIQLIENELMISKRFGANSKKNKYHYIGKHTSSILNDNLSSSSTFSFEAFDALPAEIFHKKTSFDITKRQKSTEITIISDNKSSSNKSSSNKSSSNNSSENDQSDICASDIDLDDSSRKHNDNLNYESNSEDAADDDDDDDDDVFVPDDDLATNLNTWSKPQLRMDADPTNEKPFDITENKSRTLVVCPSHWKPPTLKFVKPQPKLERIRKLASATDDLKNDPRVFSLFESYNYQNTEELFDDLFFTLGRLSTPSYNNDCKK